MGITLFTLVEITPFSSSIALDTAALLGGREYLVQQVFNESQHMVYTGSERICLNWALGFLWNHNLLSSSEIEENFLRKNGGKFIQGPADFLNLVVGFNKSRITSEIPVPFTQQHLNWYDALNFKRGIIVMLED